MTDRNETAHAAERYVRALRRFRSAEIYGEIPTTQLSGLTIYVNWDWAQSVTGYAELNEEVGRIIKERINDLLIEALARLAADYRAERQALYDQLSETTTEKDLGA